MKKIIKGHIECIDKEGLYYDVHYEITINYFIFHFITKKDFNLFTKDLELKIKEKISNNKFKWFKINNLNIDQKESDHYLDINMTRKYRNILKVDLLDDLIVDAEKYNFKIINFEWIPFQICHSLAAAVNAI